MKSISFWFFISLSIPVLSQNDTLIWQNKTPLPDTPRIDFASFLIDSNYYIVGGIDEGDNWYSSVWAYNIPTNSWMRLRNFPGGPVTTAAGFCINGHGYICSGQDSVNNYSADNEFWEYYPAVDTWQHKTNFPGTASEGPISFVYGSDAFIGLGYGVGVDDLWKYDAVADDWLQLSVPTLGSRTECGVCVIDSFAYFIGGFEVIQYNDIWRYNILQDRWDSVGIMPGGLRANALFWTFDSLIIGGYGVIEDTTGESVTGNDSYSIGTDIYCFNTKTFQWDTLKCINFVDSTANDDNAGCFVLGKTGYVFGGYKTVDPNYSLYNNMWSFDASRFFPDTPTGIADIKNKIAFSIYPNPASHEQAFSISTSESGSISFYDALGRMIDERKLAHGINQVKLTTEEEVIFYRATLQYGAIENGKVVFIK